MLRARLAQAARIDEAKLPASWQVIGDVLIAKMPLLGEDEKKAAALAALGLFPRIKTVCEARGIEGELREPRIAKLAGNGTETMHKEHGVRYALDVAKIMFSKGNHNERKRVALLAGEEETVVDMFAGIGYFALPIAKRASRVIAIEKNPVAFGYLRKNIWLNSLGNIEPINSDCRDIAGGLAGVADRIVMGYLPGTERFLPAALSMAKDNCTVHYHNTCHKDGAGDIERQVAVACDAAGRGFRIASVRKVKDYAPNVWHVVADFVAGK